MEIRNWKQAELARRSGISASQITRVLSGERNLGDEALLAISRAFRMPAEIIFRAAGLLPPKPAINELAERAEHLYNLLAPENQYKALEYLEFLKIQEERGDYRVTKTKTVETG